MYLDFTLHLLMKQPQTEQIPLFLLILFLYGSYVFQYFKA